LGRLTCRAGIVFGQWRAGAPNQLGAGGLQAFDQLPQILFVLFEIRVNSFPKIVQTPVEVDDVPVTRAKPAVDLGKRLPRVSAVFRDAMDVGFALQQLARENRVTD